MQLIWLGPLIGSIIGYFLAGAGVVGIVGALVGGVLGYRFDIIVHLGHGLYHTSHEYSFQKEDSIQKAFYHAIFVCLGRVAKCDGVVCEEEIDWTMHVMERMGLSAEKKKEAMALFHKGKQTGYSLMQELDTLQKYCHRRSNLLTLFMEMLVQAALADGKITQKEWATLSHIAAGINFKTDALESLIRSALAYQDFKQKPTESVKSNPTERLLNAYGVLGVSPQVSSAGLKKAYRRQMSQHHPDKLIAKGLPEEMVVVATEKAQAIQAAYEEIQQSM